MVGLRGARVVADLGSQRVRRNQKWRGFLVQPPPGLPDKWPHDTPVRCGQTLPLTVRWRDLIQPCPLFREKTLWLQQLRHRFGVLTPEHFASSWLEPNKAPTRLTYRQQHDNLEETKATNTGLKAPCGDFLPRECHPPGGTVVLRVADDLLRPFRPLLHRVAKEPPETSTSRIPIRDRPRSGRDLALQSYRCVQIPPAAANPVPLTRRSGPSTVPIFWCTSTGERIMRTQTLDNRTEASDPGGIRLSHAKMRRLQPEYYSRRGFPGLFGLPTAGQSFWRVRNEEHLQNGDSRAALVMVVDPLIVAAYTDELDCVALLRFPQWLVEEYRLAEGTRLLTVNLYSYGQQPVEDLWNGPAAYHRYANFRPYIAEFLSDDRDRIESRKAGIEEAEWERTLACAAEYQRRNGSRTRDGRPVFCERPAR